MRKLVVLPRAVRVVGAAVLVLGVAACGVRVDTRGNLPDPERLAEIEPGVHTRQQVFEIIGSPSSIANFNDETWYYISERTETFAFFAPEVKERQVLVLRFDGAGVLADLQTLSLEHGRDIELVDRETPSVGNEITLLEQLVGNLGRFNREKQ